MGYAGGIGEHIAYLPLSLWFHPAVSLPGVNEELARRIWMSPPGSVARAGYMAMRRATSRFRMLPSVFLLGAPKSATTWLSGLLWQHPRHQSPVTKEPMYLQELPLFQQNYDRVHSALAARVLGPFHNGTANYSLERYRKLFPLGLGKPEGAFTSDCCPFNLYCPMATQRVAQFAPDPKFIISLRNPIDRAVSDYRMHRSLGRSDAIGMPDFETMTEMEVAGVPLPFRMRYVYQSTYFPHVRRWMEFFGRERFLILSFEEVTEDRQKTADRVFSFLGLEPARVNDAKKNVYPAKATVSPEYRARLAAHFEQTNDELFTYLGRDFGWNEGVTPGASAPLAVARRTAPDASTHRDNGVAPSARG